MNQSEIVKALRELLDASRTMLAFYNDLAKSNPGFMGKLCLQDYAQWNKAVANLPPAIANATAVLAAHDSKPL